MLQFISATDIVIQRPRQPVLAGLDRDGDRSWASSYRYRKKLGLYGQLFDSGVGIIGVAHLLLLALHGDLCALTSRPSIRSSRSPSCRNALPGAIEPTSGLAVSCFGGDKLARDVFSRMVYGSRIVLLIAPLATLFALMVGITLGLPAGYFGGRIDTVLSFLANLVLAFPVILLFYLLVTPGDHGDADPLEHGRRFFIFPIIFFRMAFWHALHRTGRSCSRSSSLVVLDAGHRLLALLGLVFYADPFGLIQMDAEQLNIFVAVVFASSPAVFRIVRGLVMDIKTRDYVAAAQTRGENAVVHHAVGNPAQCARAADRRCLPADRLHHHPARHARLFRPRAGARKPGLGHGDQGCQPAAALLHPPGPAAGDRADVVRAGPEPACRRAARSNR